MLGQSEGGVPLRQAAELTYRPHAHKLIEHQLEFDTIAIPSQMSGINLVGQFQPGYDPLVRWTLVGDRRAARAASRALLCYIYAGTNGPLAVPLRSRTAMGNRLTVGLQTLTLPV